MGAGVLTALIVVLFTRGASASFEKDAAAAPGPSPASSTPAEQWAADLQALLYTANASGTMEQTKVSMLFASKLLTRTPRQYSLCLQVPFS
jgi:hypothetical protein